MNLFQIITTGLLIYLTIKINQMALTQKELATQLTDLKAQLDKVNTEVQTKLKALADAVENDDNVSPEVEAAFGELKTAIKGVDDLISDTPVEETPTP